jgi:sugar phosphate isomerase/epimerase
MKRLMFTKMVANCTLEEVAKHAKELGFDGLDLTCREGGHVAAEKAGTDLPKAVEFFREKGIEVPMISSMVTTGEDSFARDLFAAAGTCGVKFVKLGYWWLGDDAFGKYMNRFNEAMRCMDKIEKLAQENGVCAIIHTHSGNCVSAVPCYVAKLLEGRDKNHVGAYPDIGHMTVEGGVAGWAIGLEALAPYIKVLAVKNFKWFGEQKEDHTEWKWKMFPLAEGIANWPKARDYLKSIGFNGFISIHSEYFDQNSWKLLTFEEGMKQTAEDLKYLDSINF